jgi:hypothetical protein
MKENKTFERLLISYSLFSVIISLYVLLYHSDLKDKYCYKYFPNNPIYAQYDNKTNEIVNANEVNFWG